jgi:hypothetical protein
VSDARRQQARDVSVPDSWGPGAFVFVLALCILKGVRMPSRWSVTHYLFNYDFGFIKRALWGELLRRVFGSWTARYFFLAAIALAIFAAIVWLMARLSLRLSSSPERVPFLLVSFASPAVALLAHLSGYLEQLGYLWLLLLLVVRRGWSWQLATTLAAAAVLPLVHEASVLWVGALTMLALVTSDATRAPPARRRLQAVALAAAMWVMSTVTVLALGRATPEQVAALRADRTQFFSIRPRQDAFSTLSVPFAQTRQDMRRLWSDADTELDMAFSIATFAPTAILLGVIAMRRARALADASSRRAGVALVSLAIASPLLLHLVAWDRHRWNALVALNAGLAALMLLRMEPVLAASRPAVKSVGLATAFAVSLWSLSADPVFFDSYGPTHPPFTARIQFLIEAVRSGRLGMWIPRPGN